MSDSEADQELNPWGVILAGGEGVRMGGRKPWRKVGEQRLIDLAIHNLSQVCENLVVVTGDVAAMADLPCRVIADRWPGQGPLAALVTAFLDTPLKSAIVMAVDLPLAHSSLLRMLSKIEPEAKAVVPMGPKGIEPLMAYYHRDCLPMALKLIEEGERRPRRLLERVGARVMEWSEVVKVDPEGASFLNVNYPEDLETVHNLMTQKCPQ